MGVQELIWTRSSEKQEKEGYCKGGTCDLVAFDTSSMLLHYYVQENRIPIC